jgi:hypothetical protein
MTVLEEILEWSSDRPAWQRDALRRLVLNGHLSDHDISVLTEICKGEYGLAEHQEISPLTKDHIPAKAALSVPVSLLSIFHHRGANALAENQTLKFGPHLTVVYGDNAAGKSGYSRILKCACSARGREQILGNMTSGATPHALSVSIKYRVGGEPEPREWVGADAEDQSISRVSVFDTQCAAVYLTEKTDVAFRPFGLDLFDRLVQACKAIRANLEAEQNALASNTLKVAQAEVPQGTAAAMLIANVNSLTRPEAVHALANLTPEEELWLTQLERSLMDLQANDPAKLAQQLGLRARRVQSLARELRNVETILSDDAVSKVFRIRAECRRTAEEARLRREATFPNTMLAGTGSETWTALWDAARSFSQERAYPDESFPFVADGAHCVLCQQDLSVAARHRLKQFEEFVASSSEKKLRSLRERFVGLRKAFIDVEMNREAIDDVIKEIRIENQALADAITAALATNESRRQVLTVALVGDSDLPPSVPRQFSFQGRRISMRSSSRPELKRCGVP